MSRAGHVCRRGSVTIVLALAAAAALPSPAGAATVLPRPGIPVAGASVTVTPRSGTVRVNWPGDGWITVGEAAQLPIGTAIDATRGTLTLAFADSARGAPATVSVSGGAFTTSQPPRSARPLRLVMVGGPLGLCRTRHGAHRRGTVVRRLYTSVRGAALQIASADAVATARGAITSLVEDRCNGTEVGVNSGRLRVRRTRGMHHGRRTLTIHRGRAILRRGPAPRLGHHRRGVKPTAPTAPGGGPTGGPTGPSGSAPSSQSPAELLATLITQVQALGIPGDAGQEAAAALTAAQSALAAGNLSQACAPLGGFGQALFIAISAPTAPLAVTVAQPPFDAMGVIAAALSCPHPSPTDIHAGDDLFTGITALGSIGIDPSTESDVAGELADVAEAFVSGDSSDGCLALQYLGAELEFVADASGGLTQNQAAAINAIVAPVQKLYSCSTAPPPLPSGS